MNKILLLVFILLSKNICSQSLSGRIIAADTKRPVNAASVFLSNTSVGVSSNDSGNFIIPNFPQGKYDLVVSCVGYETYQQTIQSNQLPSFLKIELKPKIKELQEVIIRTYDKDGWKNWGKFFTDNFIGTVMNASECTIVNKEVLKFVHNKKQNILNAYADETLIIENNALGYKLKYQLEGFEYNFRTHLLLYYGYPLFEEMEGSERKLKNWAKNREEVYYGSIMHFMRSLYRNKIEENGFEVRKMIKKPNLEKQRIKGIYKSRMQMDEDGRMVSRPIPKDSSVYYDKILSQPDETSYLIKTILPGDSIAFAIDSTTAGLSFTDYLDITYTNKKVSLDYLNQYNLQGKSGYPISQITLVNNNHVEIISNGSYFNVTDLISYGYWAWSEKVANMLPFDYKLQVKKK
jgi:hypothetical protein